LAGALNGLEENPHSLAARCLHDVVIRTGSLLDCIHAAAHPDGVYTSNFSIYNDKKFCMLAIAAFFAI